MKTSTEHINALNDLAEGETLELNFDPMSELGDWKDCIAYPNYQISSTGAFMNKRTLKMLKHFLHKDSDKPAVTLYRGGKGDVRDVEMLLKIHFGDHAELPKVFYHNDVVTELAPPKAKKQPYKKKPLTLFGTQSNFFCSYW